MRRFIFFASKYESEMRDFAEKAAAAEVIYIESGEVSTQHGGYAFKFSVAQRDAFCEMLLRVLMDIAESENPVYARSCKLRAMAAGLRDAPVFGRELRRLRAFLSGSREMNIDGYITFRMGEFKEKLDLMIYSLVKKIKFGAGE